MIFFLFKVGEALFQAGSCRVSELQWRNSGKVLTRHESNLCRFVLMREEGSVDQVLLVHSLFVATSLRILQRDETSVVKQSRLPRGAVWKCM